MTIPQAFIDEINSYGADCLSGLAQALCSTEPETSIRLNRAKGAEASDGYGRVPWCDEGFYLNRRPAFTFDPALHQGLYYVQDASSMAITHAIRHIISLEGIRPMRYLDACAAPGGKTTAAISSLPDGSVVVANEYDFRRAAILAENVAKWGNPSVMVTRGDTSRFSRLRDAFDVVAADVPCSGEGMMRKDAEAVSQWSMNLVKECAQRQKEIVENLWSAIRPGGYMIYSTCTFNRHENEEIVAYICDELGGQTIDIGLDGESGVSAGIATPHHCYRFIPGLVRGEGLFLCVIRKPGDGACASPKTAKKPLSSLAKAPADATSALKWLDGDYSLAAIGDKLFALPVTETKWMRDLASNLDVVSAGVTLATIKGHDIIPSQELALSTALRKDAFPTVDIDYNTALAYLRRENVSVDAPKSYVLLTYKSRPLGFVKNLGNRANNLYPASWRIISQTTPAQAPSIIKD